ncbi:MAG: hypothetical protein AB1649_03425 [Chloroflexota bacterium]
MLRQLERTPPQKAVSHSNLESDYRAVLEDSKIPNTTAHRWQLLADMPELIFEKHIEETRGQKPITTSGLMSELKQEKKLEERAEFEKVRAMIAAQLEGMKQGGNGSNQYVSKDANLHVSDDPNAWEAKPLTRKQAAKMFNVSPRLVATAKRVILGTIPRPGETNT